VLTLGSWFCRIDIWNFGRRFVPAAPGIQQIDRFAEAIAPGLVPQLHRKWVS
jgi:hypothetical protein